MKDFARLATILFVIIPLSALLYNAYELTYKINLPKEKYLAIQGYNSDISWLIFFEVAALVMTIALMLMEKGKKFTFRRLLIAVICFAISIVLYYIYILPADLATSQWGYLPSDWESDRDQWEYVNLARASINLTGFCFVVLSFLKNRNYYRVVPNEVETRISAMI